MKPSELPINTVIVIGLSYYKRPAVKFRDEGWEQWRWINTGELVDVDDFKGGWDFPDKEPFYEMPDSVLLKDL